MSTEYCGIHEEPLYYRGTCESCDEEMYSDEQEAQAKAWTRQYEKGIEDERERIIKLLEQQEVEGWFDTGFKKHLIALIKRETE